MRLACAAAILAVILAVPSLADVTIKQTMDGKALGFSGETSGSTYIRGNKMRSDFVVGERDADDDFRSRRPEDVHLRFEKEGSRRVGHGAPSRAQLSKSVDMSGAKASLKPNGQTKPIAAHSADRLRHGSTRCSRPWAAART